MVVYSMVDGISNDLWSLYCNAVQIGSSASCPVEDDKTNEIIEQDSGQWLVQSEKHVSLLSLQCFTN